VGSNLCEIIGEDVELLKTIGNITQLDGGI